MNYEEWIMISGILEDHGYMMMDEVDYEYSEQYFSIKCYHKDGKILTWFYAVPKAEQFKQVLQWMIKHTSFYITCYKKGCEAIPTFRCLFDIEMNFDRYFDFDEYLKKNASGYFKKIYEKHMADMERALNQGRQ